jgi:hypothetical protein
MDVLFGFDLTPIMNEKNNNIISWSFTKNETIKMTIFIDNYLYEKQITLLLNWMVLEQIKEVDREHQQHHTSNAIPIASSASPVIAFLQQASKHKRTLSILPPTTNIYNHLTSAVTTPSSHFIPSNVFNERNEVLVLIKILFRMLKLNHEITRLAQAKKIVAECALLSRAGGADFEYLKNVVEHALRCVVGETYWFRAKRYLNGYKYRRGLFLPSEQKSLRQSPHSHKPQSHLP